MKIFQFIDEYCSDLVDSSKLKKSLLDLSEFPHDGFIEDIDGNKIPVVFIDGESVPISDILTMDKKDFTKVWTQTNAASTYDSYIDLLEVLEGEDAINRIRNSMLASKERLEHDIELVSTI